MPLMCFVCVCLEERRKVQNSSKQRVGPRKSHFFFFGLEGVWGLL